MINQERPITAGDIGGSVVTFLCMKWPLSGDSLAKFDCSRPGCVNMWTSNFPQKTYDISMQSAQQYIVFIQNEFGEQKSAKCLQQPVFPGGHPSKY